VQAASERDAPDRCPGAVQVHAAADGGLARIRLPGGRLTAAQLDVLRAAAAELGDPALELTSRANIQVRALRPGAPAELAARLHAAGLLPSESHERVRNIIASPLSGRDGLGTVDARPIVAAFDAGLCASPRLAELPGRFLATIDDGRGDVSGLGGDVGLHGTQLLLAGLPTAAHGGAELLLRATEAFAEERSTAWRLAEVPDGPARVAARLGTRLLDGRPAAGPPPAPGVHAQADGRVAVVVVVPLGLLTGAQSSALAAAGNEIIVTPWRTAVAPAVPMDEAERIVEALTAAGLVADAASPWAGVTACAGRPGCASALGDVRADARAAVAASSGPNLPDTLPVHWVGCERRCGAPRGRHVEMLATADGYLVSS